MTDETRTPTARVVITFYDREIEIEGDDIGKIKNSSIKRLEFILKRAVNVARREARRNTRIIPDSESIPIKTEGTETKEPVETKKPALVDSLQKLGIKLNKSEGVNNA